MLAPICLFTYNRLEKTKQTINALKKNFLANQSHLIIFSDGAKDYKTKHEVNSVRRFLYTIDGFKSVKIIKSPINQGLGESIINGVTKVINNYGKVIVLEDDLYTTANFLDYMNQALDFYETHQHILSICGYGLKIKRPRDYTNDFYLYGRASSWGWATWLNRWQNIDWAVQDWETFKKDKAAVRAFNKSGSDMFGMLKKVLEGQNNSWAIRFCYNQFKHQQQALVPFESFVKNIGFDSEGTNTKHQYSRFKAILNPGLKRYFVFDENLEVQPEIQKACFQYHSIIIRIYSKLRYLLNSLLNVTF